MSWFGNRFKRLARSRAPIVLAASGVMVAWRFAAADTTANWQFPVNGNWTDNSIWSTHPDYPNNGTPLGVNYLANISAAGTYTVALGNDITIDGLTLNSSHATLSHSAGTLNLNAGIFNLTTGTYQMSGGTLSNGILNFGGGSAVIQSGTLDNIHITGGDLNLDQASGNTTIQNGLAIDSHTINMSGSFVSADIFGNSLSGNNLNITNYANINFDGLNPSVDNSTINIAAQYFGQIYVGGPGSSGPTTFTMGTHATLSGVDAVTDYHSGSTLVNNGNINANVAGQTLSIQTSNFTNHGLAQATNGGTLTINSNWNNTGTLAASNASAIYLGGSFTTAGIGTTSISADSTVNIAGAMDNTASTFTPAGGTWYLNGGSITNGTMNLSAGNFHAGTGTLDNVHVTGGDLNLDQSSGSTTIQNGLTVDSHNINMSGSFVSAHIFGNSLSGNNLNISNYAYVYFDGVNPSVDNSTINISGQYNGQIYVGGPASGGSTTFTMGTHATLSGAITVGDYSSGSTLINNGKIDANVVGQTLSIQTSNFINHGLAEATNGGTLTINSNWNNTGTLGASNASTINLGGSFTTAGIGTTSISADSMVNISGAMDNTTATFTPGAGSWFLNGGSITNGTMNLSAGNFHAGTGTLDNVHVTGGDLNLDQASGNTTIQNGLVIDSHSINMSGSFVTAHIFGNSLSGNNLNISNYAYVYFDGVNPSVDNSTINIPAQYNGQIYVGGPSSGGSTTFTMGTHATLSGAITVGDYSSGSTLINNGKIDANVVGQTLSIQTSNFINHGLAEATNGGTLTINSNWNNTGTLGASNASTINLGGSFTTAGIGTTSISADSMVNISGAMDNTTATFTPGAGSWFLNGGSITNGTMNLSAGNFHAGTGTLDNVHVTGGDLNLDQASGNTTIQNGLVIDSHSINMSGSFVTAHIFGNSLSGNNLNISNYAYVYFDGVNPSVDNSTINIPAQYNGQIYVGGPSSGGSTTFTMGTHATLSGAITVGDYSSGSTLINNGKIDANVVGQTLSIQTSNFINHGLAKATNGGILEIGPGTTFVSDGSINTSGGVLDNEATAQITGAASFGSVTGQGSLLIGPGLSVQMTAGSAPSIQSALTLGTGTLLNIRNNNLTLSFGTGASPNSMIRNYISSGYNVSGTPWSGTSGITSSNAAADPAHRTVAFADGADGVVTNLPVNGSAAAPFGGALPAGYELITYAYGGDGNLDGKVDFADFIILSNHFGTADTNWDHGNFNYDPSIDFADFIILSNNFGAGVTGGNGNWASPAELAQYNAMAAGFGVSKAQIAQWDASIANIPEPGAAGMLMLGSAFVAVRRRRRASVPAR